MIDTNEVLGKVHDAEEIDRAQRTADYMTGDERPQFASEEERMRTIAQNYMGSVVNIALAMSSTVSDIYSLLHELLAHVKKGGKESGE